ncbi:MAG: lipocalin-like domain-containing protein [Gammaproteobacteria bacterium]
MRLLLMFSALVLAACSREPASEDKQLPRASIGLRYLRAKDDAGFARAEEPRALAFPVDHGSHPWFRTEWWYFTGNLKSTDGDRYGFELTFFRVGLRPPEVDAPGQSAWRRDQIWMAHLAVTDATQQRFVARERIARDALDLAGAAAAPARVWVKGWSAARGDESAQERWRLSAGDGDVGLQLNLTTDDAPVPNGEAGLDRKGPEPGNASYYYSLPRLATTGVLKIDGREVAVEGNAWMDREWSTSALADDVAGWDWFGLRLSDGGSLMFYRLRRRDGTADAFSGGMRVDGAGRRRRLTRDDVELTPIAYWASPVSGTRYPIAWQLKIPSEQLALELRPYVPNQELSLSVRYWEGAVSGSGTKRDGGAMTADGYLELAGY